MAWRASSAVKPGEGGLKERMVSAVLNLSCLSPGQCYDQNMSRHNTTMQGPVASKKMPDSLKETWVRFSSYEVRNGFIRPSADATLVSYDPWEEYDAWKNGSAAGHQPPYQSLFALVNRVRSNVARDQRAIADWCSQFGLLGILPLSAESVSLAPYWIEPPLPHDDPVPFDAEYLRYDLRGGQWHSTVVDAHVNTDSPDSDFRPEKPVPPERWISPRSTSERFRSRPGLFSSVEATDSSDLKRWSSFFPAVPEAQRDIFPYPQPLSTDFWPIYAEPVSLFLSYARDLFDAVAFVPKAKVPKGIKVTYTPDVMLEYFLEPIGISIERDGDGRPQQRWRCPSLLSMFAMMAILDLGEGFRLLRCADPQCETPFITRSYQSRFCSDRCAWRTRKREQRK